jgi:signal transduction histidine kinase
VDTLPEHQTPSAENKDRFILAALLLMGEGMAPEELSERLSPLSGGDPRASARAIEGMALDGLIRIERNGGDARYVPGETGKNLVAAVLKGQGELLATQESLETMRTELLASIAHEFRTPLTAVRTAIGLLQDPALPHQSPQEARLLKAIAQSAQVMQRLVTDFLELARFRAGTIGLELRRFDAGRLAHDAVNAMASMFESRGQIVSVSQDKAKIWVEGDRRRLLQALLNLLSNAHKFAPQGSEVEVRVEQKDDFVQWVVSDAGPGIDERAREKLFERYFTISRSDSAQGTGLGLPLALATAEAHGGTVTVVSEPGEGSSFILTVPARAKRRGEDA